MTISASWRYQVCLAPAGRADEDRWHQHDGGNGENRVLDAETEGSAPGRAFVGFVANVVVGLWHCGPGSNREARSLRTLPSPANRTRPPAVTSPEKRVTGPAIACDGRR